MVPPVTAKLFISMECTKIDETKYLDTDTSIDCESTEFKRFEAFAGIFIAAYLCLPLLWAFLIYRVRHQLDPATRDHATFGEDTDALLFLFTDYRPSCKYTECMEM